jgi:hypothetical protein
MATPHDLNFIQQHPLLSPGDRRGICTLLAGPRLSPRAPLADINGVRINRAVSHGPRRIYRVYGSGDVDAPAEVGPPAWLGSRIALGVGRAHAVRAVGDRKSGEKNALHTPPSVPSHHPKKQVAFQALSNLGLIPAWDVLFKGAKYLEFGRDEREGGVVEVGRIHLVYGVPGQECARPGWQKPIQPTSINRPPDTNLAPNQPPLNQNRTSTNQNINHNQPPNHPTNRNPTKGVSRIVHDRDFVLRAVRVFFPSGACVLCCRSVGADEGRDGDPGPGRNMIRWVIGVGVHWGVFFTVGKKGAACMRRDASTPPPLTSHSHKMHLTMPSPPTPPPQRLDVVQRLRGGPWRRRRLRRQHLAAGRPQGEGRTNRPAGSTDLPSHPPPKRTRSH